MMTLVSEGIDRVRAFGIPCGIFENGQIVKEPRFAMVTWSSNLENKFYQVYVNGQFAGSTVCSEQRNIAIPIPGSFETAVRIEVFAVEPEDYLTDFSSLLNDEKTNNGRVKITFLRSQDLPAGAKANVYYDGGTGEIDYSEPLNESQISIWPTWQDKAGFAMSMFGLSDFGFDWSACLGFGQGDFGQSEFGTDADVIEWISEPLGLGVYKFAVVIKDEDGNDSDIFETDSITVTSAATPAEKMDVYSFDKSSNQLVLSIV